MLCGQGFAGHFRGPRDFVTFIKEGTALLIGFSSQDKNPFVFAQETAQCAKDSPIFAAIINASLLFKIVLFFVKKFNKQCT